MSDVINDATRFRARLSQTLRDLEHAVDLLHEHGCDCPPEWPRCTVCSARLRLQLIKTAIDNELKKVKL